MCSIKPDWCDGYEFYVIYMVGNGKASLAVRNWKTEESDSVHQPTRETTFNLRVGEYPFEFKFTKYAITVNGQNILSSPGIPWWKIKLPEQGDKQE